MAGRLIDRLVQGYQEGGEVEASALQPRPNKFDISVDTFDKSLLRKKFFELNPE